MTRQHFSPTRAPLSEEPEPLDPGYDPAEEAMSDQEWASLLEEPRLGHYEESSIAHLYNTARIAQQQRGKR